MQHYKKKKEPLSNSVTQAEFGRVIGLKPTTIGEFKRDGRLVLIDVNGAERVLVNESIDRLNSTMTLHGAFNASRTENVQPPVPKDQGDPFAMYNKRSNDPSDQLDLESNDAQTVFNNAKALKEKFFALKADVDYRQAIGDLVEKTVVEKIIFERARQFRDGVTASSKRLAPLLVGKESLKEIEIEIDKELRYMLDQFSKLPVIE